MKPRAVEHILWIEQSKDMHGRPVAGRFDGRVGGRQVCAASTLPLFDAARRLIQLQLARPDDLLALRMAGTDIDLLREPIARAAKLAGAS
jgi:hypothetical protein